MAAMAVSVPTANDRLKSGFDGTLAAALVLATLLHAMVFDLWPEMTAVTWANAESTVIAVIPIDTYDLPPQPEPPGRPATPVASAEVSPTATLPTIGFDEYLELPPPPPAGAVKGIGESVPFTPYTVPPRLSNSDQFGRALQRAYPASLRDAGLGGTVVLLVHVSATGEVLEARVGEASGYPRLDTAALELAEVMRLTPALNRDQKVAVWVSIPLTFKVR